MIAPAPEVGLDPFSLEALTNPYPHHVQLREAGPVLRLTRYGIWGMARHAEVSAALQDWQTFCSSRGGGLTDFAKEKPWRPPSIVLEADPPLHTRTRGVLVKVLSRPALIRLRENMEKRAEALLDEVLIERHFDGYARLAETFPLHVFPDAVGIVREGRENLLPYGDMAFNAFGPRNDLLEAAMRRAGDVIAWITAQCRRSALSPNGFGSQIYAEVDAGNISEEEAALLVRSLLTAGLDTTIQGIAHALHCFATWPEQWQALRENPSLVRDAFEEVIRYTSPVQTFFRTTTKAIDVAGTTIPEGEKVLLFLAAANRDPRRWDDPDRFDIRRQSAGHVGFGYGIHQCVGQMVARMEAEVLLRALTQRVASFELDGEPTLRLNNTLRGLSSLPLRVRLLARQRATSTHENILELRVTRKQVEALDICSFELVDPAGGELPGFPPGSHLDVQARPGLTRQYSLCNDPGETHRYLIAVLRDPASRGGSKALHEDIREGDTLRVSAPKNHFPLAAQARRSLLLAGGIGVTPILCMAEHLARSGADFEMHYCTRSVARMAFRDRILGSRFASRVRMHFEDGPAEQRLDIRALLSQPEANTHVYVCGPRGFIEAVLSTARAQGWPEPQLHYEFFAAEVVHADADCDFEVQLARSGHVIVVRKDITVARALQAAGVTVPVSCEQGVCGTCLTRVLEGTPDHRDSFLTADERAANDRFTPCCSRAKTRRLVLDL